MDLTQLEKANSFGAVRSFLKSNDRYKGCSLPVELIFQKEGMPFSINETIEVEYKEFEGAYVISCRCNSFASFGIQKYLWSNYQLFQFDKSMDLLHTSYNGCNVTIKK
jgi:hypothetical protein